MELPLDGKQNKGMRFFLFLIFLFLFLSGFLFFQLSVPSIILAAPGVVEDSHYGWVDMFGYQNPRWDWDYQAGTGYKELGSLPDGYSGLEIGITSDSTQNIYSDCSLHEVMNQYRNGIVDMRLRLSDDNGISGIGRGTRGWGFWDANMDRIDAAWFWSASADSAPELTGLRAIVIREGVFLLNQPIQVDMREWHVYRIELTKEGTRFFVDDIEVAFTPGKPANDQRIELWIDNMAVRVQSVGYTTEFLDLIHDQKMFIDWVKFWNPSPEETPTPVPGIFRLFVPFLIY